MATLSKHGELGQLEKLDHKLCYCADGNILINRGDGWKMWKRLKPGIDPVEHWQKAKQAYSDKIATSPMFAEWRQMMHDYVPFVHRFMVRQAISLMPDDCDGVCSEVNDFCNLTGGVEILSFDDAYRLCTAYKLACAEAKENAAQPVA